MKDVNKIIKIHFKIRSLTCIFYVINLVFKFKLSKENDIKMIHNCYIFRRESLL